MILVSFLEAHAKLVTETPKHPFPGSSNSKPLQFQGSSQARTALLTVFCRPCMSLQQPADPADLPCSSLQQACRPHAGQQSLQALQQACKTLQQACRPCRPEILQQTCRSCCMLPLQTHFHTESISLLNTKTALESAESLKALTCRTAN